MNTCKYKHSHIHRLPTHTHVYTERGKGREIDRLIEREKESKRENMAYK